ncbi:MAG TPA: hypothetical protein VFJ16_13630 [Longimicrobium sp.]|nr:hypothetical protein [Longimicrobium sp.]
MAVPTDLERMLLTSSSDLLKQMVSLSTIVLGVTLTFWKESNAAIPNRWRWPLPLSWISFFAAIVCGVVAMMFLTGSLHDAIHHPDVVQKRDALLDPMVQVFAAIMQVAFLLGTILTVFYGFLALKYRDDVQPAPKP